MRAKHIEEYLVQLHSGQWFGWSDSKNKVYANLIIHDNSKTKPTEQECTDGVAQLQADYDALEWKRKRQTEYPSIEELVVALYDTEDKLAIETKRAEVKARFPK